MSSMSLEEILTKLGYAHLIEPFKEQDIDLACLMVASDAMLKKYIPRDGPLIRFREALKGLNCQLPETGTSLFQTSASPANQLVVPSYALQETEWQEPSCSGTDALSMFELPYTIVSVASTSSDKSSTVTSGSESVTSPFNANKRVRVTSNECVNAFVGSFSVAAAVNSLDVKALLMEDVYLKTIITASIPLTGTARRKIVAIIANALLKISDKLDLKYFEGVVQKIVEIFPEETAAAYYLKGHPPHQPLAKGKLIDKYRNSRVSLPKVLPESEAATPHTSATKYSFRTPTGDEAAGVKDALAWLKYNRSPWGEVTEKWDLTYDTRLKAAFATGQPINKYYEAHPVLRHKSGSELLISDFNRLHPLKSGNLFSKWPCLKEGIIHLARENVKDTYGKSLLESLKTANLSSGSTDLLVLSLLPSLCHGAEKIPLPRDGKKKLEYWKPSVVESRAGFILHVKCDADVQTALTLRRDTLGRAGLTCQPTTVAVGSTLLEAKHFYVSIDSELYNVPGPLQAIDTLFKCFFALNAKYPMESRHLWVLLQRLVYDINCPSDKPPTSVTTLMHSLKVFLSM